MQPTGIGDRSNQRAVQRSRGMDRRDAAWWAVAAATALSAAAVVVGAVAVVRKAHSHSRRRRHRHDPEETRAALLTERRQLLGPNLSVSFADSRPLCIVEGRGAYLYDADGTRWVPVLHSWEANEEPEG